MSSAMRTKVAMPKARRVIVARPMRERENEGTYHDTGEGNWKTIAS